MLFQDDKLRIRKACMEDVDLYFEWVNDSLVRSNSFRSEKVDMGEHRDWFINNLNSPQSYLYVFELESDPVGQVRIVANDEIVINISISEKYRGCGLGVQLIRMAVDIFYKESDYYGPIHAMIKKTNSASIRIFEKAGFSYLRDDTVNNIECLVMTTKGRNNE